MDPAYVIQIGKMLGKDFSNEITELKKYEDPDLFLEEPKVPYAIPRKQLEFDLIELQKKYIHALEDIRDLQRKLMDKESKRGAQT